MKAALRIRHRVTHPKATTDLSISDEELDVIGKAFAWFLDATFVVYVPGRANVLAKIRAAETEIGRLRAILPGGD